MDLYKKNKRKSIICWVIAFALAIFYLVVSFLPFIFMVLNSFKEKFEMLTKGVFNLPDSLNFTNYKEVLTGGFGRYFMNSDRSDDFASVAFIYLGVCFVSSGEVQV